MNGWQIFVEIVGRPPVELRPGESLVGRSRTCQVHIPETTVSRQHARLVSSALGEVTVEDLGSSNGTFVNGEKVEGRRKLADGDKILIGDAELRMRIVAPVAPTEATVRLTLPPLSQIAAAGAPAPMAAPSPMQVLPPSQAPIPLAPPMPPAPAPTPLPADALDPWEKTPPGAIELPLEPVPRPAPPPMPAPAPLAPPPSFAPPAPRLAPHQVAETVQAPAMPPPMPAAPPRLAPPPAVAAPRPPAPLPPPMPPAPAPAMAPPPQAAPLAPPAPPAQPRMIDPPLQAAAPPRPAPPPAPSVAPPPAPPRPPAPAPARKEALGSVTGIDRIPIPEAPPAVVAAARMERAQPAGFWIRFAAWFIDCIPAFVIAGISVALTLAVSATLGSLMNLISFVYGVYVFVVMPALKGKTIGMGILGLQITHPTAKAGAGLGWPVALMRFLGHIVCFPFTLGIGYLLVAFTSQKQGLHDLIAGTRVVRVR